MLQILQSYKYYKSYEVISTNSGWWTYDTNLSYDFQYFFKKFKNKIFKSKDQGFAFLLFVFSLLQLMLILINKYK